MFYFLSTQVGPWEHLQLLPKCGFLWHRLLPRAVLINPLVLMHHIVTPTLYQYPIIKIAIACFGTWVRSDLCWCLCLCYRCGLDIQLIVQCTCWALNAVGCNVGTWRPMTWLEEAPPLAYVVICSENFNCIVCLIVAFVCLWHLLCVLHELHWVAS